MVALILQEVLCRLDRDALPGRWELFASVVVIVYLNVLFQGRGLVLNDHHGIAQICVAIGAIHR